MSETWGEEGVYRYSARWDCTSSAVLVLRGVSVGGGLH